MEQESAQRVTTEPDVADLDDVTSYEDGDHHVICDTKNPNAWIRAEETADVQV